MLQAANKAGDDLGGIGDAEGGPELSAANDEGDAGREADDDRVGNIADIFSKAQEAKA